MVKTTGKTRAMVYQLWLTAATTPAARNRPPFFANPNADALAWLGYNEKNGPFVPIIVPYVGNIILRGSRFR